METYQSLMAQIEKLTRKAESVRKSETKDVVKRIRDAIAHYDLTPADLGFPGAAGAPPSRGTRVAKKAAAKTKSKTATTAGQPKYRDPQSGKTWTGRGKPPGWIAGVADRNSFLIDSAGANAAPTGAEGASGASGRGKGRGPNKSGAGVPMKRKMRRNAAGAKRPGGGQGSSEGGAA